MSASHAIDAVDAKSVVAEALQVVQPAADAKEIQIAAELEEWIGFIQRDAARLQQVVSNLLSNAVKFTPVGGAIHVLLRRVGDMLELQVRDSGHGIPASGDDQLSLFSSLSEVFKEFRGRPGRR